MIYHDTVADGDVNRYPANRYQLCLNCKKDIKNHSGWSCNPHPLGSPNRAFNNLAPNDRYLTQSMVDSLPKKDNLLSTEDFLGYPNIISNHPKSTDLSDWKVWRNLGLQDDECVCRMKRNLCTYHK